MKTNTFIQTTSRKSTTGSVSNSNSNFTFNKILPANKVDRNTLLMGPPTSGGLDRQHKYNHNSKSNDNDMTHYLSHSPNKITSYIESLKDKIFSPGDFTSNKPSIKNSSLIQELTRNIFNTPPSMQKQSVQSLSKGISPLIYLPEKTYNHLSRKTLFLDLDETLVHSAFKPFYVKADITLNISFDQKNHTIYVLKRPHVDEFLDKMSKIFELVIFTASIPEYANPLLNKLDPNKHITSRLFREHCTASNNLFVKDLKRVGRHLKDTILLDNNPVSYAFNKENGLPILTWHSNKNDSELLKLIPLLEYLSKTDDVRDSIQKVVSNNYVNYFEVNRLINPIKEEEKVKTNQTTINSINTLNSSINNGASVNYSMNLFSHHFSPFYFDTKDKDKCIKDIKDKCTMTSSNTKEAKCNNKELSLVKRDKDKDQEKEVDLFSNFFECKKGTGNLFNDKKYKDKYDQFYDIKDSYSNSNNIFRKNSNKGVVLPSNEYLKKEQNSKNTISDLYHNESSFNIKKISESTSNQSILCKSLIDQDVSRATSSRSNNFYSFHNNINNNIGNDLGLDLNVKNISNTSLSNSIDKKPIGEFKRNRNDFDIKKMNNFVQKATISLQDPIPNIK